MNNETERKIRKAKLRWVRIKQRDHCFHVRQLCVAQVKHHNTVGAGCVVNDKHPVNE